MKTKFKIFISLAAILFASCSTTVRTGPPRHHYFWHRHPAEKVIIVR
ncbi:MAG: hypothetical protein ABI855_04900 [Bacteroidota bacterium]